MHRGIARIFTHRAAGTAWAVVALGLALALGLTLLASHRQETFLRSRIAALAVRDAGQLQAELVSCRATVRTYAAALSAAAPGRGGRPDETTRVRDTAGDPSSLAAELAATPPAGFDVCARMESADQAVLKTLDRR